MRSYGFRRHGFAAWLATAALVLIAGTVGAVIDADVDIAPNSPGYNGSGGFVDTSGISFESSVYFTCADDDNDFDLYCETNHPDKVSLSTNQGTVGQMKKGNNANAVLDVVKIGGIAVGAEIPLSCEKVQVTGKLSEKTGKIEAQCKLKGCEIPNLTVNQVLSAIACIDASLANGSLGGKVQNLKLDKDNKIGGKIKSKGTWF